MIKWEYKVVTCKWTDALDAYCGSIGNEGWELVSMIWDGAQYVLAFKRR